MQQPGASVVTAAKHELDAALSRAERSWPRPPWPIVVIALSMFVGAALSLLAAHSHLRFMSSFAPADDGRPALLTLWQVDAAIVAIGIPLLTLIIQSARTQEVLALSEAEVVLTGSRVRSLFALCAFGLVEIGVAVAWLASDATLALQFVLVFIPTLIAIGYAYAAALSLLMNPADLRRRSSRLLQDKLSAAISDRWIRRRADEMLRSLLEEHGLLEPLGLKFGVAEGRVRRSVRMIEPGRIADVDPTALIGATEWLVALSDVTHQIHVDGGLAESSISHGSPIITQLPVCGADLDDGDVLVEFELYQADVGNIHIADAQIRAAFTIDA